MDEVGITEHVKGDNRKFEIWYGGKEEIYIVQVGHLKITVVMLQNFSFLSCRSLTYCFIIIFCDVVKHFFSDFLKLRCTYGAF